MMTIIVFVAAFVGVAALVGGVAMLIRGDSGSAAEDRLDALTGAGPAHAKSASQPETQLLNSPLDDSISFAESMLSRMGNIRTFLLQAGSSLTPTHFLLISIGMGATGVIVPAVIGVPIALSALGVSLGILPFVALFFKRKSRLAKFAKQLPEALELISRALRAGHSLAAGFNLVCSEMADPIAREFGRCYEEQNFGIPLDEALEEMTQRVPNLDLRFFATAVILQRQTGGDLAEILDKIGTLIRERFKIWGQIQALTGEGRLSGIVLLALPPVLFLAMFRLNPDYVMILFTDPLGHKMLAVGIVMQLVGALVIRKIINIKV